MSTILKYSVGIDMSKNDFNACISVINTEQKVTVKSTKKFTNSNAGIKELIAWSQKHHKDSSIPLYFLMEATGIYHENLAWTLYSQSFNVIIVLPTKAKRYLQSIGNKSKNDKIDAQGLAQMCSEQSIAIWKPATKQFYILRSLTRLHEDLSIQRTSLKSRIHASEYAMFDLKMVAKSHQKLLKVIEKEIETIELEIAKTIQDDPVLKQKFELINSIKGVGLMTFAVVVAETNGFALFKNARQLMSYAGYDIVENQSGTKKGKTRISKKGNTHIRRILHLPAFNLVTYEPYFKVFYERIFANTGMKMKAYTAVQRKLLCLIYTLWNKNESYKNMNMVKYEILEKAG
jgi:transposase